MNKVTLAKYDWELKQKYNITPTLKWHVVKPVPSHSNVAKSYMLFLHKKFKVRTCPNQDE